jgi:hypothetical protein
MDATKLIKDLTETEILSLVREMFTGESLEGIKLEPLIEESETLGDLYAAIRQSLHDVKKPKA